MTRKKVNVDAGCFLLVLGERERERARARERRKYFILCAENIRNFTCATHS